MRSTRRIATVLVWAGLAIAGATEQADAGTVSLEPVRDVTLIESTDGSTADGQGPHFRTGRTNQGSLSIRRGLIAFDVAGALPHSASIVRVTLILHMSGSNVSPDLVSLHRVVDDWGEGGALSSGGSGVPAAPGDSTWLHRFHNPAVPADSPAWNDPGGDFVRDESAATTVGEPGYYAWSSPRMTEDVRSWLHPSSIDHGWMVIGDESAGGSVKRFDSGENDDLTVRPLLIVEFRTSGPRNSP
jgi:hypothetical protein